MKILCFVLTLALQAGHAGKIPVYVFHRVAAPSTYVDPTDALGAQHLDDSVVDVVKALTKSPDLRPVTTREEARIVIEVVDRGYQQVGTETTGTVHDNTTQPVLQEYLQVRLTAGDFMTSRRYSARLCSYGCLAGLATHYASAFARLNKIQP